MILYSVRIKLRNIQLREIDVEGWWIRYKILKLLADNNIFYYNYFPKFNINLAF